MKTTQLLQELIRFHEEKYNEIISEVILDYNTWDSLFEEVRRTLDFLHMNNCSYEIKIQFPNGNPPVKFSKTNKREFIVGMIPENITV